MLDFNYFFSLFSPFQILVLNVILIFALNKIILSIFAKKKKSHTEKTVCQSVQESVSSSADEFENDDDISPALPENLKFISYSVPKLSNDQMLSNSKNFYDRMSTRRTVRFFSSESVSEDVIRNIVRAAGTSPSGAHTEPWTFVIVKDAEVKRKIREIVEEEECTNYKKRMGKKWINDLKPFKTSWIKPYLTEAPYLILMFKQLYLYTESGIRKNHYYNEISVGIASGILIAAIHFAGLVTLTSTPLNCGVRLRKILGRPESEKLILLFPVGLPAQDCVVPDLRRKTLDEISIEI